MNAKLSILTFPQKQVGKTLYLNVLIVPRNFDPLLDDDGAALSPAWVNSTLRLQAMVIDALDDYPRLDLLNTTPYDLPAVQMHPDATDVFTHLKTQFNIVTKPPVDNKIKPGDMVRKYLPFSYRQSFNFTNPRNKNLAALGDEYNCAVKQSSEPVVGFTSSSDDVSWGKVFAYCLRQPELAKKCGFVHKQLTIELADNTFKNGGWLYVDLHPDCSYYDKLFNAVTGDQSFVKRYAAKIPKLDLTDPKGRNLFAAVEFPVLISLDPPAAGDPAEPAMLDDLQVEASVYDDGFCKLVHSNQPLGNHLLKEEQDDEHPVVNDIGIRLGWDDEQLLEWMNRQLSGDAMGNRNDAPLGVFQYRIDVRKKSDNPAKPKNWIPLCRVKYAHDIKLGLINIGAKNEELELGVEVYPMKLDATPGAHYWLPSYFSQWIGHSLVLQDTNAIDIFQKDNATQKNLDGSAPKIGKKNDVYKPVNLHHIEVLYGHQYEFRVRMADTTGGGPALEDEPVYDAPSPVSLCHFKRHVVPSTLNFITPLPQADDALFIENKLTVKRPRLGYPSVLFTGGYDNVVAKLIADGNEIITNNEKRDVGLYDPDVDKVEVWVEVRSLGLDTTIRKRDAKDSFAILYKTYRSFPKAFDANLDISFTFIDAPVLSFTGSPHLPDLGLNTGGKTEIDERTDLVLPTARDIRITVRPVTIIKPDYYGGTNEDGSNRTALNGMISTFVTRKEATNETGFFKTTSVQTMIRGVYLQPEEAIEIKPDNNLYLVANLATENRIPTIIERLATTIAAESRGMSLLGNPGERWQFGVSRFIRHTASPDNTSITFATKSDLLNHWIVPVTLLTNRDWSWDGIQPISINIYRRKIFLYDAMKAMGETDRESFLNNFTTETIFESAAVQAAAEEEFVGDIELKKAINIQALIEADRSQTYLCFLDAVEPKQADITKFPDELLLSYRAQPSFIETGGVQPPHDEDVLLHLHLPITTPPAQMPKVVSAGLAFSKYIRDERYANTEPRQKYLWIEFDKPVANTDDAYFARMLAYSPDPLLAKWSVDLLIAPQEPALPVDPEPIRVISSLHSDDKTGINAMQQMIQATDSEVHYLVPLPHGLHAESAEMFGFFTYEFRVGHKIGWSTAQGRFGRALRNTGVQHPMPQLFCVPSRNETYITVSAPFAQTVFDGRNVTSQPPRTQLWALLYAQVRMADDSDERNILLGDKRLVPQIDRTIFTRHFNTSHVNIDVTHDSPGWNNAENIFHGMVIDTKTNHHHIIKEELATSVVANSDAVQQGVTGWANKEAEALLDMYGLPHDSPLSVLCVEMMPGYDNFLVNDDKYKQYEEIISSAYGRAVDESVKKFSGKELQTLINFDYQFIDETGRRLNSQWNEGEIPRPLTSELGKYRILRTSTLAEVPAICCTE